MLARPHAAVCILVLLVSWSAAQEPPLPLPNADFEAAEGNAPADWPWWSREGGGSATVAPGEGRNGSQAAFIQHDDERDWAFSNSARLKVEPKQEYTVSGWVRGEHTERVEIAIVALSGGKTLYWSIGGDSCGQALEWTKLQGGARIPNKCDEVYVRLVGSGVTRAYIDDVSLKPGAPPRVQKPKVSGWAERRVTETLDRGLVAIPLGEGRVRLSWRNLAGDSSDLGFHIYRRDPDGNVTQLTDAPVTRTTDFVDETSEVGVTYTYQLSLLGRTGREQVGGTVSCGAEAAARPYLSIKLDGDHDFQKVGLGDLDGDGRYDFVFKQPNQNVDPYVNYWKPSPGTYKLEAYTADGRFLWRRDLGWAIEQGIWYSPYVVADLDGDGKAEVAVKTGEGDPRDEDGRVQTGPEYLSILSGLTGDELVRTDWPSRERFPGYNYASRNQMCVAYLDGKTPCLIVERGTYNVMQAVAYQFHNGELTELWRWEEREEYAGYRGQGAHIAVGADVDGDGRDEVVLGSCVLDDNGVGLWSTGLGHPDHMYVGEIDPTRPGLEIYYGVEAAQPFGNGMCLVDARTGDIIWGLQEPTKHVHSSGLCADIDADHEGCECYAGERDLKEKRWLFSARGELLSQEDMSLAPRAAYWDADPQRELVRGSRIFDYAADDHEPRPEGRLIMVADLLGDWREEIITTLPGEMRIYTTMIPATDRRRCLLQDPLYRSYVVSAGMGYYQVPMQSEYFGARTE